MLKEIAIITISVSHLGSIEQAYETYFGYQTVDQGTVSEQLAEFWQAPEMVDHDYVLMEPAKMSSVYLRFVQNDAAANYAPMKTLGWNAFELLVKSPDALVPHLQGSPFEVLGPPRNLYPTEGSPRIMQVRGPASEIIYLTRPAGGDKVDSYADTFVGPSFIVINGGSDMDVMHQYFKETFGLPVTLAQAYPITIISRLNDLPLDTTYPLSLVPLPTGSMIELDQYPESAGRRPADDGVLPPGIAAVSFTTDDLPAFRGVWLSKPRALTEAPYAGRLVGLTVGPSGEWIEVIGAGTADGKR